MSLHHQITEYFRFFHFIVPEWFANINVEWILTMHQQINDYELRPGDTVQIPMEIAMEVDFDQKETWHFTGERWQRSLSDSLTKNIQYTILRTVPED